MREHIIIIPINRVAIITQCKCGHVIRWINCGATDGYLHICTHFFALIETVRLLQYGNYLSRHLTDRGSDEFVLNYFIGTIQRCRVILSLVEAQTHQHF